MAKINGQKLAKVIPLLGSDKQGEVLAAVAGIQRVLESTGASLHDLARAIERLSGIKTTLAADVEAEAKRYREATRSSPAKPRDDPRDFQRHGWSNLPPPYPMDDHRYIAWMAKWLQQQEGLMRLTNKEADFVASIQRGAARAGFSYQMTAKQKLWWNDIVTAAGW